MWMILKFQSMISWRGLGEFHFYIFLFLFLFLFPSTFKRLTHIVSIISVNGLGYFFIFGTTGEFFAMYLPCFRAPEQPQTDVQLNDFSKPNMVGRLARVLRFWQKAPKNDEKDYFDDLMERRTAETVEMELEMAIKG